jgi:hypothetical protein
VLDEEGIGVGLEDEVLHEGLGYIVISLNRKSSLIDMLSSIQCCGSGMFIPDPGSEMFIPDPGSDFFPSRIPDLGSASKNLSILTKKNGF